MTAGDTCSSPDPQDPHAALLAASGVDATGQDGTPATDREYLVEVERTVGLYAAALATLHSTPLGPDTDALHVTTPDELVARSRRALADGRITRDLLTDAYRHVAPERLVELFEQGRPSTQTEVVLVHGRPALDRLRCRSGAALGFVGWERSALADPYLDLAVAARQVATRLSPVLVPALLEEYATARRRSDRPDPVRLDWYALAAELLP